MELFRWIIFAILASGMIFLLLAQPWQKKQSDDHREEESDHVAP